MLSRYLARQRGSFLGLLGEWYFDHKQGRGATYSQISILTGLAPKSLPQFVAHTPTSSM